MRIVVSGSSGLIGSALVRLLRSEGGGQAHDVVRLVRHDKAADDEVSWDPGHGVAPELAKLGGVDAVVHLAGAGVGDHRWSDAYKREIHDSRVGSTKLLATAIAGLDPLPRAFLCGSAVGYYGDTGDSEVDESSPPGKDFLAETCVEWEASTTPAEQVGIRTVHLRTGIVLTTKGGALGKVLPLFRVGLGGRLGSGKQYLSWIARPDHVAAIRFLLDADAISGPVNLTAPFPVKNREYTQAMAAAVHRPAMFPAPSVALRLALGGFADSILTGQRVLPRTLTTSGFEFGYPDIDGALKALIDANA